MLELLDVTFTISDPLNTSNMENTLFPLPATAPPRSVSAIKRNKDGSFRSNPMVVVHGPGPADTRCKACDHLFTKQFSKAYHKCTLRPGTVNARSPQADHRVNWQACGKFTQK
jgi:hypothetical protein